MTRTIKPLGVLAVVSFFVCSAQQATVQISVSNPGKFARHDETISVDWKELSARLAHDMRSVTVTDQSLRSEILFQLFDSNLDGTPEALLFQSDFAAGQNKTFMVRGSSSPGEEAASLVDARFVEPRQDLAWENDRIAFRMYGPALAADVNNGIDVWTKRVRYLIVKKWYEGEEQTPKIVYHIDHGEGADFFNVGRSLGCGGSGIWKNEKVYQPGVFSSYKIISTGPIRTCFELYFDNWSIDGVKLKETKRITLDAGQNLNKIEVLLHGSNGTKSIDIACGLVKRENTKSFKDSENSWMSLWGQVNDSMPNGYLGTGMVFENSRNNHAAEDKDQYLFISRTVVDSTFTYYAGAGWTRSGDFAAVEDWNDYLDNFAKRLRYPLTIGVSVSK